MRGKVDYWFWRGLTAVVFAGTLGMCFVKPVHAAETGPCGVWRIALDHHGGPLAHILNPPERLRAERVTIDGDTISLAFPSHSSRLMLTRGGE